ncbi:GntR family transcriptional regulator [uncultured Lactobacillus sp.]|uniref:GntR family transcriptional regulator n=1 Tax=uncultured Lactobacillus sp. TaxID=153152 RepID=UPI002601AC50|nr:GntR family transcriptional regulator [uncultured Lactobacillus sp.]
MENKTVPLYQQMIEVLIHQIEIGALKENDKLPSEQELGETFQISRITVRKALEELQKRNFIYKKQGQGSFVSSRKQRNKYFEYWDVNKKIREMGTEPSSKINEFNIIADKRFGDIKEEMHLKDVDYLYEIHKTYFSNKSRIMVSRYFIAFDRCPEIKLDELEQEEVIPLILGKYALNDIHFSLTSEAGLVDRQDRNDLDADLHDPKVIITRRGFEKERLIYLEKTRVVGFLPMYLGLDMSKQ